MTGPTHFEPPPYPLAGLSGEERAIENRYATALDLTLKKKYEMRNPQQ